MTMAAFPGPRALSSAMDSCADHMHGGPDADGVPLHDFSTNANALGPCPPVLDRLRRTVPDTYPDPAYVALRERLASWHGVSARQIVMGASASELIVRVTAALVPAAVSVWIPRHAYGDYRRAALAWGLTVQRWEDASRTALSSDFLSARAPRLIWVTAPGSPQGDLSPALALLQEAVQPGDVLVVDCAYAPLCLEPTGRVIGDASRVCRLFSPNKALGMTGVRGGYLVLPASVAESAQARAPSGADAWGARLAQLAPSWPLGSYGAAMLMAWPEADVQQWLAQSRQQLSPWKGMLLDGLRQRGWQVLPGVTNFCCARAPMSVEDVSALLPALRHHGIKVRDATSFGLPGHVRFGVRSPQSQMALWRALDAYHPAPRDSLRDRF